MQLGKWVLCNLSIKAETVPQNSIQNPFVKWQNTSVKSLSNPP